MKEPITWTTKDGKKLIVDEITDINHLRNLVKYLIRKNEELKDEVDNWMDYGDYQDTF